MILLELQKNDRISIYLVLSLLSMLFCVTLLVASTVGVIRAIAGSLDLDFTYNFTKSALPNVSSIHSADQVQMKLPGWEIFLKAHSD